MFDVTPEMVRPFARQADVTDSDLLTMIGRLERLLVAKIPSIVTRTAADPALLALAQDQIIAAAARFTSNPLGIRQETEGSYSILLDRAVSSGQLGFTAEELALLSPPVDIAYGKPLRQPVPCWRVL